MQKQAKQIKKELKSLEIEAEENGVIVVVSGNQDILEIKIPDELCVPEEKIKLEKSIVVATARAMKKSQEIAAERMKPILGDMGMPGQS